MNLRGPKIFKPHWLWSFSSMDSELPPSYDKATSNGNIEFRPQATTSRYIFRPTERTTVQPKKEPSTFSYRLWFSCAMSFVVLLFYVLVTVGCTNSSAKQFYLMKLDNSLVQFLINSDSYFADPGNIFDLEVQNGTSSSMSMSAGLADIDSSTLSRTRSYSRVGLATQSATVGYSTTPSTLYYIPATSAFTAPEALYLPKELSNYTVYMGDYGSVKNGINVYAGSFDIPYVFYVGIWSFGYTKGLKYKARLQPMLRGIDLTQMYNSETPVWVNMLGINFKESTFPERNELRKLNNIARALQPLSIVTTVSAFLFLTMAWHIVPRSFTIVITPISLAAALTFNVLYTIVATKYVTYLIKAFPMEDVFTYKGSLSVRLLWFAFGFQLLICFIEMQNYIFLRKQPF